MLPVLLLSLFSCTSDENECRVVTVKILNKKVASPKIADKSGVINLNSSVVLMYLENERKEVHIPVADQDIIEVYDVEHDMVIYYQYHKSDGTELAFRIDPIVYLNDRAIGIFHSGDARSDSVIGSLSDQEISQLEYFYFLSDSIPADWSQIDRVAALNPQIGIISEPPSLNDIMDKFHPEFLFAGFENCTDPVIEKVAACKSLKSLIIKYAAADSFYKILKLPRLEVLVVLSFECFQADEFTKTFESLTLKKLILNASLSELNLNETNIFSGLENLQQLAIVGSNECVDLSGLKGLKKLESLYLVTDSVSNLSALNDNNHLKRFAFPFSLTRQEFNDFISSHQELEYIQIPYLNSIEDLSPLQNSTNLSMMVISYNSDKKFDPEMFKGLEHLEYLSVGPVKDSTSIPALRSMLPTTVINENTGFCLGSGYLLLIIPFFLVIYMIVFIYRKSES